jgi:DNA helicase-2/ATP-dependent DNA helicase PcrA
LNLFIKTAWPVIAAGSASIRDTSQGVRVDIGARMRGMWR